MTHNKNSNRYYSNRQEKSIAKAVGGKTVPNSGAIRFGAGDVTTDDWLIEAKTCTTEKKSFSIKREWLDKNREEAFAVNKHHNALCFDFGDNGNRYYVISEKELKAYMELLGGE